MTDLNVYHRSLWLRSHSILAACIPSVTNLLTVSYFQAALESKREALTGLLVQLVGEQQKREDELMRRLVSPLKFTIGGLKN